jgi:hypothetical protein
MDPYLENPVGWPGLHTRLITRMGDELAGAVRPNFYVHIEERVYLTHPHEDAGYSLLVPDVIITRTRPAPPPPQSVPGGAMITAPTVIEMLRELEIHDAYLEIRDARTHDVITAIELLSPANKLRGSHGHAAMMSKREQLREAGVHLLEIDLLRAGERLPEVEGHSDYGVLLFRRRQTRVYAWFIALRDPLPTVAVPLRPPFADVPLPLQSILDETYARAYRVRSACSGASPQARRRRLGAAHAGTLARRPRQRMNHKGTKTQRTTTKD